MNWSPQQVSALDAVGRWLDAADRPLFRLFGYAGTGKTSLARHIADTTGGTTLFAAFTGKAAYVLRRAGCPTATTLHSLLYRVRNRDEGRLDALEAQLAELLRKMAAEVAAGISVLGREEKQRKLEAQIAEERKLLRRPIFELNPDSPLADAQLLIVDECSMVDERLGTDVLSFGVPVLVLGDPAQLPPIYGGGFFTAEEPDALLTEIHRQAADSQIIALATAVREGRPLRVGMPGVVARADFDGAAVPSGTQIIVGRNKTRRRVNEQRRARLGFSGGPTAGDRVVCLRNNHDLGLLNGGMWTVAASVFVEPYLSLSLFDDEGTVLDVEAHPQPFAGEDVPWFERREAEEFDFSYAITAHKAQGSQFQKTVVIDESRCFGADQKRWRYTAITRAIESVIYVL